MDRPIGARRSRREGCFVECYHGGMVKEKWIKDLKPLFLILGLQVLMAARGCCAVLGLSEDGHRFTLDGKETFLMGISYYGALSAEDPEVWAKDLQELRRDGVNWIRVWAYWQFPKDNGENVSVMERDGSIREALMQKLEDLVASCDELGIVVDVTLFRDASTSGVGPPDMAAHTQACLNIARRLLPCRNVYVDVANERDVRDGRYVSLEECGELIRCIKSVDPKRLCTASCMPVSLDQLSAIMNIARVDLLAPHLCRHQGCADRTQETVKGTLEWMRSIEKTVPIHLQEPFRRGYGNYEPEVDDFLRDLAGAVRGGAAGWCFHNGAQQGDRPFRSFSLASSEGRLYEQLDASELAVLSKMKGVAASVPSELR